VPLQGGTEKAGVGGSIPSLATTFEILEDARELVLERGELYGPVSGVPLGHGISPEYIVAQMLKRDNVLYRQNNGSACPGERRRWYQRQQRRRSPLGHRDRNPIERWLHFGSFGLEKA
jgi:hypothetical protein